MAVNELEKNFREGRAKVVSVDHVVDQALLSALNKSTSQAPTEPVTAWLVWLDFAIFYFMSIISLDNF